MASFVVFDAAMYSDSTVDSATVGCFLDDQATLLPATSNTKPLIDHLVSGSCAQYESVHPTKSILLVPCRPRVNEKCAVAFRYLRTRLSDSR